ncbi:Ppx/GppA family phosphatase [bacterium]|nr:Ppx/GppA family phosphatase [bacterium]
MAQAVIDIGTNTVILLVAEQKKSGLSIIHDEAHITRLGQGISETHCFNAQAIKRTLDVLKNYAATCKKLKVKKIVAVGTAACRNAANADVFIDRLKKECGLKLEVISGNDEADYVFNSAYADFGKKLKKIIVVDIGGGSTEIITGPGKTKAKPEAIISIPFGSVKLTEQYIHSDPVEVDEFKNLVTGIRHNLKDELEDLFSVDFDSTEYTLVATAGTATTLASVTQKLKKYDSEKVHGSTLKKEKLESLINEMLKMTISQRQKLTGIEPLRADVILAGAVLLYEILSYFKKDSCLISDRGLRFGVFYKKFAK